ncbi:PF01882 family protein [Actinomyces sp. ICM54]|nr:PF01882 family protein [Actinomyces sp. ICM54]
MRTDTPTMVSPKRAQAVRSHPLKTLVGAVTTTGWAVITLVIVGLALAVAFQWVEALACALAGVVALVLAAMRVAWRPPHVVSIRVPNERIVAGQTAVGEISVRNERARSVRSGIIELPIGTGTGEFVVPPLGAHETWDEMFLISSRHRGIINVGPARAVRSDALGLLRRVRMWDEPVLLHVHPRTVRVPFDATGFQLDVEGVSTGKLSSSDVSFHALRDYEPGDDRRAVHWQSTARLGKLIVRQYEETHRSHHVIVLDTSRDAWDHDTFETAVSVAGSLGLANLRESRPVSLSTTEGWLPSGVAMRMLDALSEVKARSFGDLSRRVREAVAQRPGVSALTLIVGPNVTDIEAAHLARLAPIDVPVSIIRIGAEGVRARRDLGRGVLLDCSTLDDLPRIIVAGGLA